MILRARARAIASIVFFVWQMVNATHFIINWREKAYKNVLRNFRFNYKRFLMEVMGRLRFRIQIIAMSGPIFEFFHSPKRTKIKGNSNLCM